MDKTLGNLSDADSQDRVVKAEVAQQPSTAAKDAFFVGLGEEVLKAEDAGRKLALGDIAYREAYENFFGGPKKTEGTKNVKEEKYVPIKGNTEGTDFTPDFIQLDGR
ncbi:MAG: hypothetical protein Q7R81_05680 [Candidatus Peregrinibacteria bacterium]|nr:hypothetical protein [Candidatus Peregrinibacteria bacterium]